MKIIINGEAVEIGTSPELEASVQELLKAVNGDTTTTPPVEGLTDKVTAAETDIANIQTALVGTTEQPGIDSRLQTLENTAITDVVSDGNSILTTVTNKTATVALNDTIGVDTVELGADNGSGYEVSSILSAVAPTNERGLYVQTGVTPDSGTLIGNNGITMIVGLGEDATLPIRRVAYPTEDTDAANKQYVDEAVAGASPELQPPLVLDVPDSSEAGPYRAIVFNNASYTDLTSAPCISNYRSIINITSGGGGSDISLENERVTISPSLYTQAVYSTFQGDAVSIPNLTTGTDDTEVDTRLNNIATVANAAQTTANQAKSTAQAAQTAANNALPLYGGEMLGYISTSCDTPGIILPIEDSDNCGSVGGAICGVTQTSLPTLIRMGSGGAVFRFAEASNIPDKKRGRLQGIATPVNASDAVPKDYVDAVLPSGAIIMFNGEIDPPAGWMVCDGSNGTPNIMASWPTDFGGVPVVWLQKW